MSNPRIGFHMSLLGQSTPPTPPFSNLYSMNFDGVDESFTALKNPTYYNTSIASISIWFKCTSSASYPYLYGTGRQYVRLYPSNKIRMWCYSPPAVQDVLLVTAPTTYTDGNWHHILAVIDSVVGVQEIFYDGASIGSRVPVAASLYSELGFAVGSNQAASSNFFNGNIDEVARWHDTNQSANIGAIYNGGTPPDLSLLATQPTNWWRMGENGTWNVISWDLVSQGIDNATALRSINMEIGDRVADTPP